MNVREVPGRLAVRADDGDTVLVCAGDGRARRRLVAALAPGHRVLEAADLDRAVELLEREWIQVVLADGAEPWTRTLAETSARRWPEIPCVMQDGGGADDGGCSAFGALCGDAGGGALRSTVQTAAELFRLRRETAWLRAELQLRTHSPDTPERRRDAARARAGWDLGIVRSPGGPMDAVCELVRRVGPFDVNVLLTGESGTGKELCARALHASSLRAEGPFVAENCGALGEELLASELFGHRRGAFTGAVRDHRGLFEQADRGTLFLDEVGELSPGCQVQLLRVLQEHVVRPVGDGTARPVDVRVIAATNRDLAADVRSGRFREDLYFRLAGVTLELPPLRERPGDLPALAEELLEGAQLEFGKRVKGLGVDTLERLAAYAWPGNVRELDNELRRMLILADRDTLGPELLSPRIRAADGRAPEPAEGPETGTGGTLRARTEALEERVLRETLARHGWNKTRAAEELGLSRVGLRNKVERYGLIPPEGEAAAPEEHEP